MPFAFRSHPTALVAPLLVLAVVASGSPAAAQNRIERIDDVCSKRTEIELGAAAGDFGTPILPGTLSQNTTASNLFVGSQLESARQMSLADLARGLDLAYVYSTGSWAEIPAGFYTQRVEIDDPTRPEGGATLSLIAADGSRVAEGVGHFKHLGVLPDPGDVRKTECTLSTGDAVDENGDFCMNTVAVCTNDEGGVSVFQSCLKTVE